MDLGLRRDNMLHFVSINDYVQDGIVFWIDGIMNTRNGHNASSTKWEDLTTTQRDITYKSNKILGNEYCILNGQSNVPSAYACSNSCTVELVLDIDKTNNIQMILPWNKNNYGTVFYEKTSTTEGAIFFNAAATSTTIYGAQVLDGINTYTARGKNNLFVNGSVATLEGIKRSANYAYSYVGYYRSAYPWPCISRIYAIRIYNRLLTDEEVIQNRKVDAIRFR